MATKPINIIQGATKKITIDLVEEDDPTQAFDLTGFTLITVCIKSVTVLVTLLSTPGTRVTVVGDPKFGRIEMTLTVDESTSLPETNEGDIEVAVDKAGVITKTQALKSFTVSAKICAA